MFEGGNCPKGRAECRGQSPGWPEWHSVLTPTASAPILTYLGGSEQGCRAFSSSGAAAFTVTPSFPEPDQFTVVASPAAAKKCPTEFESNGFASITIINLDDPHSLPPSPPWIA